MISLLLFLLGSSEITYSRPIEIVRATVTAYSKAETCPNEECITSSGKVATSGLIACPRAFKLGTRVEILGVEYECADRTHKRFDGRFDIFKDSYAEAKSFGIKNLEIVITPPLP